MIQWLIDKDIELFLYLNGSRNAFSDAIMPVISHKFTFIPLYLLILWFIIKLKRPQATFLIIGIILSIVLSDQISVHLFKNVFHRLRPCHNPDLFGMVQLIDGYCGGKYGFVSSHAANTFALATFVTMIFHENFKWVWWIFAWSSIVGYSRIYLGVHYPLDILVGSALGILCGFSMYKLQEQISLKFQRR